METDIKTKEKLTEEEIELYRFPAILLDDAMIVVGRNRASAAFPIRKNCKINRYLFSRDVLRMQKMTTGQELRVPISLEGVYLAIVHKLRYGYLVTLRLITARVWQKLTMLSEELAVPVEPVSGQLDAIRSSAATNPALEKELRRNYFHTLRFQIMMSNFLSAKQGREPLARICEINGAVATMIDEAVGHLLQSGFHPSFYPSDRTTYANVDIDALRCALAELLSVVALVSIGGRFVISTMNAGDEFSVQFSFEPLMDDDLFEGILSEDYSGDLLLGSFGDVFFDLYMVQMLSDCNGWDFCVREEEGNGLVCARITIPTTRNTELQVNCPDSAPNLVMGMLSNLL